MRSNRPAIPRGRRITVKVAGVALLLGLLPVTGGAPRGALGQSPPARPNILIIVTDDQREGLGVMPDTRRWFVEGGTKFTNGYVTTPLCCPSRASILTGRYAHNHGVLTLGGGILDQRTTLHFHLKQAGYSTAIFGKFLNNWPYANNPPYFDQWALLSGMYPSYVGRNWNVDGTVVELSEYPTRYIADRAEAFLEGASEPWFLYLAPPNPHQPYTTEPAYSQAPVGAWNGNPAVLESDRSDKPPYVRNASYTLAQAKSVRARQLRTLMSVDDMVQRVFATLESTGALDDTLAFYISDNGYTWGEHGLYPQKAVPYTPSIEVPFLARWPGHFRAGAKDARLVANIDIAPTIFGAVGLESEPPVDGHSLLGSHSRERLLLENWWSSNKQIPKWTSLLTPDAQYVEYRDSSGRTTFREYYDLRTDPWQLNNLRTPPEGVAAQLAADRVCAEATCP